MALARSVTPRTRFEVFKRDKFSCQYCGRKAPDVILNADHIHPVSEGGTSDLMNLVTSCAECNGGKSDKLLADDAAVTRSRAQAETSEERRQQIEMMANWQVELAALEPEIAAVNAVISKLAKHSLTDTGIKSARSLIRKFGLEEVMQSVAIAFDRYGGDGYWSKVPTILRYRKADRDDPDRSALLRAYNNAVRDLPYHQINYNHCRRVIEGWHDAGHDALAMLRGIQGHAKWWSRFRDAVSEADEAVQ
jgi:hypothetical protein